MSTEGKVKIQIHNNRGAYTREQKLVATVWYHERLYTGMTYTQLSINFEIRFKAKSPSREVLRKWDKKLFKDGFLYKPSGKRLTTYIPRLVYIPYVKESFLRFPDLVETSRAKLLGMNIDSLRSILRKDLSPHEIELWKQQGREKAASGSGSSSAATSLDDVKISCAKGDNSQENDNAEIEPVGVEEDFTVEFNSDEDEEN